MGCRAFLRSPRTTQELRRCSDGRFHAGEGLPRVKLRNRKKAVPTFWDDRDKAVVADRCWKNYRLTQYK